MRGIKFLPLSSNQQFSNTVVGDVVNVWINITLTNTGGLKGTIIFDGLPIASANNGSPSVGGSLSVSNLSAKGTYTPYLPANLKQFSILKSDQSAYLSGSDISNSSTFNIYLAYLK